jgi:hypothetical protein
MEPLKLPTFTIVIWGAVCVLSLIMIVAHVVGRGQNKKRAIAAASALEPLLRAQFAAPFAPGGDPVSSGAKAPAALADVDRRTFEAWHTGRRNVRGMLTRLDLLPRAAPLFWMGHADLGGASEDTLTLELPLTEAPEGGGAGGAFLLSLLEDGVAPPVKERADFEKFCGHDGKLAHGSKPGAWKALHWHADHKDIPGAVAGACPLLGSALADEKARAALLELHYTDHAELSGDRAFPRSAKLSARVLQLKLKCPGGTDAAEWRALHAPWVEAALQLADKLSEGINLSTAAKDAARIPREKLAREKQKKAEEVQREKDRVEREKREEQEEIKKMEGMTRGAQGKPPTPLPLFVDLSPLFLRPPPHKHHQCREARRVQENPLAAKAA